MNQKCGEQNTLSPGMGCAAERAFAVPGIPSEYDRPEFAAASAGVTGGSHAFQGPPEAERALRLTSFRFARRRCHNGLCGRHEQKPEAFGKHSGRYCLST